MAKKIKEQLDYGNRPERMDPNLERKLASPDNLYAQNPAMRKKEADVQRLVSNRFQKVAEKLSEVTGIEDLSSQQVQGMIFQEMMRKLPNIMRIESRHKEELEQLAVEAALDESEVPEEYWIDSSRFSEWEFLKGAKSLDRVHKESGFVYRYSEGSMAFPDHLDRPSRTIL